MRVMEGRKQETPDDGDSTGIGLDNVVSRLELYYQQKGPEFRFKRRSRNGDRGHYPYSGEGGDWKCFWILLADDEGIMLES